MRRGLRLRTRALVLGFLAVLHVLIDHGMIIRGGESSQKKESNANSSKNRRGNSTASSDSTYTSAKSDSSREFYVLYYAPSTTPISVREYVLGSSKKPKRYDSPKGTIQFHYRTKEVTNQGRKMEDYDIIFFTFPPLLDAGFALPTKSKGQIFVAWICENACLYPQLAEERVRAKYPSIDYTISTSKKSSWWYSWTGAFPLAGLQDAKNPEVLQTKPVPFQEKKPAVLAIYGNCKTETKREVYLRELSRYFSVESRGGCEVSVNNHQRLDQFSFQRFAETVPRKLNATKYYMFTAAMENAVCTDYVSEKVFQALAVGSVPIYLGATNAARDYLPSNSAIVASNYTAKQLAEHLHHLSQNQEEYEKYLAWKQKPMERHVTLVWEHSIDHILDALLGFLLGMS